MIAQSPNTAAIVVVSDQTDAAVPGAQVSIVSLETGAARHLVSGADGSVVDARAIEETPLLGRKLSYLPLLNGAFRPAKGTARFSF